MEATNLQQQLPGKPLFSNLLWSRPEQKTAAGKLAIIGGSSSGFNSVSATYEAASLAGAGTIRALLPDSLKKTLSKVWPESEFAASNKSGSFAASALSQWIELASWADGVILSGDLSKNSETAILFERFLEENKSLLTLAGDSLALALDSPTQLFEQNQLTLVVEQDVLQRLLTAIRYPMALRRDQNIYQFADLLHSLSQSYPWAIISEQLDLFFVAYGGEISTTIKNDQGLQAAGCASAVWRLQQPAKPFAAITSAIYSLINAHKV